MVSTAMMEIQSMRIIKIVLAALLLACAVPSDAKAQCSGQAMALGLCGNPTGSQGLPRWAVPSSYGILTGTRLTCDDVTDNAVTINAAVAALPTTGGIIQFVPNGVLGCGISSMVTVGNGVGNLATNISTANSTRNGIVLRGISNGTASAEMIPQQGALVLKWLGASSVFISGAANNGAGLIRLTVSSTAAYTTGAQLAVNGIVGTVEANGPWTVTVIDATHFDLQGSTFTNAYVSGGTIGPIMVKVAGPTSGIELSGIVLDCNLSCSTGLLAVSATTSRFDNLLVRSYYGSAYIFTAYASGVNLAQGMLHSPLTNIRSSGPVAGSGATGITIGASTMGVGLLDVSEITITDSLFTFDGTVAGSSGILLQFADAITFIGGATVEQGVQVANTYGLRIVPPTGVGGSGFPAAIAFLNPVLYGNVNNPGAGWAPTQGVGFYGYPKPGGAISLPVGTTPSQFWGNTLDGQSFGWASIIIGSDIRDSAARQFSIGNTTGDSFGYFGQSTTRGLFFGWNYNATAGNAFASISTNGNSNPLAINASAVNIQGASGLPTVIGGSFTLSTLGVGIAHVNGAGLVTSSSLVASDISNLGTGVGTWLTTPSVTNFASAITGAFSGTKNFRAAGGAGDCTVIFSGGLATGGTC